MTDNDGPASSDRPASKDGPASSFVQLGGSDWELWPEMVLRSAGFPAAAASALSAPELASAADSLAAGGDQASFEQAYRSAVERLSVVIGQFAADQRFREAIAWQNRALLDTCLDKARKGEPRNARGRNHELTIAAYIQRYCLKNDTIGFFGPVGWASWSQSPDALQVGPGHELLSRRRTYFESWALDAVGAALAAKPELEPWLLVRPAASNFLEGRTVHFPNRAPRFLSEPDAELIGLCDGARRAAEIADELLWSGYAEFGSRDDVLAALRRLASDGLIAMDLHGPVEAHPEATLRGRLASIPDPPIRELALRPLDDLIAARDAASAAAGDADAVADAIESANRVFEAVTGATAVRRQGATYAGRTIFFEDTVRDVRVELGRPMLDALAGPLSLLLDSAAWFVSAAAESYEQLFTDLYKRGCARHQSETLPLAALLSVATPHMFRAMRHTPAPVLAPLAELQRRWARVLGVPPGVRRHEVSVADVAGLARAEFPAVPAPWSAAVRHSPDVMIAASGAEAIDRGDFRYVLGELHLASNTIESRVFVEQHEDPDRLRDMERAMHGGRRCYLVPPKEWRLVTSRTYPPSALLTPDDHYWSLYPDAGMLPVAPSVPAAAMRVGMQDGRLVVSGIGPPQTPLAEVIAEQLSATIVSAFSPMPPAEHVPRVTIGKLVMSRESWTFPASDIGWAVTKDESLRYRQARQWRAALQMPERLFYRVPIEEKPIYLDFTSIVLVNLFARTVRRTADHPSPAVSLAEMLPDVDQTWLVDGGGLGYCAELRLVAVNRRERTVRAAR